MSPWPKTEKPLVRARTNGFRKGVQAARLNGFSLTAAGPDAQYGVGGQAGADRPPQRLTLRLPFSSVDERSLRHRLHVPAASCSYRAWTKEAGRILALARATPSIGPFAARLIFDGPDQRRRDVDNLGKAVLDLLVRHGVVKDDHLCRDLRLSWSDLAPDKPGGVTITVEAVS